MGVLSGRDGKFIPYSISLSLAYKSAFKLVSALTQIRLGHGQTG